MFGNSHPGTLREHSGSFPGQTPGRTDADWLPGSPNPPALLLLEMRVQNSDAPVKPHHHGNIVVFPTFTQRLCSRKILRVSQMFCVI